MSKRIFYWLILIGAVLTQIKISPLVILLLTVMGCGGILWSRSRLKAMAIIVLLILISVGAGLIKLPLSSTLPTFIRLSIIVCFWGLAFSLLLGTLLRIADTYESIRSSRNKR